MLGTALLILLAAPAETSATNLAGLEAEANICRDMAMSSSRLDRVRVCKSRAEWRQWDLCHTSVPRDCTLKKKTVRVSGLSPNEKLVCKTFRETASRIGQRRFCATKREWQLVELQSQDAIRDRQAQSLLPRTQTIFRNPTDGAGPQ